MHRRGTPKTGDVIERVQVERLATSILTRSPHELAEIAIGNPAIYGEWMAEISRRSAEAQAEARRMSLALQSLQEAPNRARKRTAA